MVSPVKPVRYFITFMSSQLRFSPTLMRLYFFYNRMAAGRDHVLSMPCRFINYLIGTSIRQLIQNMDVGETDFFDYDVVIMPFEEDGQRSFFGVGSGAHQRLHEMQLSEDRAMYISCPST